MLVNGNDHSVCVVGLNLPGLLSALLLSKLGMSVSLFEMTNEIPWIPRHVILVHQRDLQILESVGLGDSLRLSSCGPFDLYRSRGRGVHCADVRGLIWVVDARKLRSSLISRLEEASVPIYFSHNFIDGSSDGHCVFLTKSGTTSLNFGMIIAADENTSTIHDILQRDVTLDFHIKALNYASIELPIPPMIKRVCTMEDVELPGPSVSRVSFQSSYALRKPVGVQLWYNRGCFLTTIPLRDKSAIATFTVPLVGAAGVSSVDADDEAQVLRYFRVRFPSILPIMPNLVRDFQRASMHPIVVTSTHPSGAGRVVLVGSAAHREAPCPYLGDGAQLTDACVLYQVIQEHIVARTRDGGVIRNGPTLDFTECVAEYTRRRDPEVAALTRLSEEHLQDAMSPHRNTLRWLLREWLGSVLPRIFAPMYVAVSMEGTGTVCEAIERLEHERNTFFTRCWITAGVASVGILGLTYAFIRHRKK